MIEAPAILARHPTLRRWTRSVWRLALRALHGDRVVQERMGLTLLLDLDNPIDKYVAAFGQWENDRIEYLLDSARARADGAQRCVFLDIGAHWGLYALRAWKTGVFDRIVAFEPDSARADQLRENLELNGVGTGIEVVEAAASDVATPLQLGAEGRLVETPSSGTVSVEAVAVDDVVRTTDALVVAKIDVEGFEFRTIRGMARLLTLNQAFLQVEVWEQNEKAVGTLMDGLGYRLVHRIGHDHYFGTA